MATTEPEHQETAAAAASEQEKGAGATRTRTTAEEENGAEVSPRPKVSARLDAAMSYGKPLTIIHFNDVYNVEGFKKDPAGGAARFRSMLVENGGSKAVGEEPGSSLVLFSGDAFAPSVMSTMLKGAQVPPVLDALGIDCAMYGNHDLDFGLPRCEELAGQTRFPWLLSNCVCKKDSKPMAHGLRTVVLERGGKKIGLMGLIEYEWLTTLATVGLDEIEYTDFVQTAIELSAQLRADQNCDCVIALTHMRQPNDARLAREVPPGTLDLVLGGHDHHYEVFEENGVLICKSGTDFKDATKVILEFPGDNGKRCKVQSHERLTIDSRYPEDPAVKAIVDSFAGEVEKSLDEIVAHTTVPLDARFQAIRTSETNCGNLVADVIRAASGADVALLNSGTLRSDAVIPPGSFTKRDLVNLLPMADEVCVIDMTGAQLLAALENGVSQWPRLEGRFPQVSGVRCVFDPSLTAGSRVSAVVVGADPLDLDKIYSVALKQYMRTGKDGYDMIPSCPVKIDSEDLPALQNMLATHFDRLAVFADAARIARCAKADNHDDTANAAEPLAVPAFTPIAPKRDGRITLAPGNEPVVQPAEGA